MKYILITMLAIMIGACSTTSYTNPETGEKFTHSSIGKTAEGFSVVSGSPEHIFAMQIDKTSNDDIFDNIADIVAAYK